MFLHLKNYLIISLLLIALSPALWGQTKRGPLEEPFIPGQLIIQFDEKTSIDDVIANFPSEYDFKIDRALSKIMRIWLIEFNPEKLDQLSAMRLSYGNNGVTVVQNNHLVEVRTTIPNDPNYNSQWHHKNTGQGGGTSGADIQSEEAWSITTGGKNANGDDIVVCILEQVDFSHNDLNANHWVNTGEIPGNGIDDDGNGYIDDIHGWNVGNNSGNLPTNNSGHGTNVAGMIGAVGNNSLGVVGANWDVKMMNVVGYNINSEASVIAAYEYPLVQRKLYNETKGEKGAFVVSTNASWGIDGANPNNYPLWCAYYDTLGKYGILNCGATTNQNLNVDVSGDMPTACSSKYMVGVGRSDRNDNFQGGYGLTTVNFAAPGVDVVTTANGNTYTSTTGTSFASPLTAGVIALMYSIPCDGLMRINEINPQLAADIVFEALMEGTESKASLQDYFITGGRLNAKNAIDILKDKVCSDCIPPFGLELESVADNSVSVKFQSINIDGNYMIYFKNTFTNRLDSITTNTTSLTISDLRKCTRYEIYAKSLCEESDEDPKFSNTIMVETEDCGACVTTEFCAAQASNAPPQFSIMSPLNQTITNYTETAGWGANMNDVFVAGNLVLVDDDTENSERGCQELVNTDDLTGNIAIAVRGTCNFSIKALRAQNAGALGLVIINDQDTELTSLGAGSASGSITIPVIMISQADGEALLTQLQNEGLANGSLGTRRDWIERFNFNHRTFETGDNDGYLGADILHLEILPNTPNTFSILPQSNGENIATKSRIYIDYNLDGVFSEDELVFEQENASAGEISSTITIPNEAPRTSTKMRVILTYYGDETSTLSSPCESFVGGEIEDYCVLITDELNTSIIDIGDNKTYLIYPNPSSSEIVLETTDTDVQLVQFYDMTGQKILELKNFQTGNVLNIEQLNTGVYFCHFINDINQVKNISKLVVTK